MSKDTPQSGGPDGRPTGFFDVTGEHQLAGRLDADQSRLVRERQAGRTRMMGLVLGGLALLFFAITVVKTGFLS